MPPAAVTAVTPSSQPWQRLLSASAACAEESGVQATPLFASSSCTSSGAAPKPNRAVFLCLWPYKVDIQRIETTPSASASERPDVLRDVCRGTTDAPMTLFFSVFSACSRAQASPSRTAWMQLASAVARAIHQLCEGP
jgi:hypothetical protein